MPNQSTYKYKIRKQPRKDGSTDNYSITVPKDMAKVLSDDMIFEPVFTDEGILYRPIKEPQRSAEIPVWAGGEEY